MYSLENILHLYSSRLKQYHKRGINMSKTIGERNYFSVNVFPDEYQGVGVTAEMTLSEAQTQVRATLGVPAPMRKKGGKDGGLSSISRAIASADEDTRKEITELLASRTKLPHLE